MSGSLRLRAPASVGEAAAAAPGRAPWPAAVGEAWARRLATGTPPPGGEAPLAPGWWLRGDALRGTALFDRDPFSGHPRRWAEADRHGHLHAVAAWLERRAPYAGSTEMAWARLRLPEGWLELEPGTARHPLWGASDRIIAEGVTRCRLAAQPWGALRCIPALDRPGTLPPGAGEAALNWLAALAADQGRGALAYVGPYPTAHLFDALLRSFHLGEPEADPASGARERFARDELAAALSGSMGKNPVRWAPDPWCALQSAPGVLLRHRERIETVWIGTVPFRIAPLGGDHSLSASDRTGRLPAGERLWREGPPGAPRIMAGLALLGEPYRVFLALDEDGRILEHRLPPEAVRPDRTDAEMGPALSPLWHEVIRAWCALRAAAPLAPAVLGLRIRVRWAPLPLALAARGTEGLCLQSGLIEQFRRLALSRDPGELALMLLSDVAAGLLPHVLAEAQAELEAGAPPKDVETLLQSGAAAQAQARETLAAAVPLLVRALAKGRMLDRD